MYGIYEKALAPSETRFKLRQRVSLLGYRSGLIYRLLKGAIAQHPLSGNQREPVEWGLDVQAELAGAGMSGTTLIIDAKPKGKHVSLYEVLGVWGVSGYGWTPMTLRMRDLVTDAPIGSWGWAKEDFTIMDIDSRPAVYTFLYAGGTIRQGGLEGQWLPPKPSSTNHVFLWPGTLKFFLEVINDGEQRTFVRET